MNGDLGTDGPTSKMKKMLEDILPDLTKIEEENDMLKVNNLYVKLEPLIEISWPVLLK